MAAPRIYFFARLASASAAVLALCGSLAMQAAVAQPRAAYELNDAHFHLTNYVQKGPGIDAFLELMGDRVGRVALFGIPLQQTWSFENSGDYAPDYYLETDAPLYYYSFVDASIASVYLSLRPEHRARFDPMITGFNPADMYAVDHIERVLRTFPGVFTGIGEFTIHKEFVSSKVAGDTASLTDPALDRILDFAGEVGLVVILHNDLDVPFARPGAEPVYLTQMKDLLRRHPDTTIIWAHVGLGRVVRPAQSSASAPGTERAPGQMTRIVAGILEDPGLAHVHFDISWDEVAKYIVASPEVTQSSARIINEHSDRFLFGTDTVAPTSVDDYLAIYEQYAPLWAALTPEAAENVKRSNYERLFDAARVKVRAWENANVR